MEIVLGILVIRREDPQLDDSPEDVIISLDGLEVLNELHNVPLAITMVFALVYTLNLSYPSEWKYTFEAMQKIIMGLDGQRLSKCRC